MHTSGQVHTATYLQGVASSAGESAEWHIGWRIGSFVTGDASNMVKMRRQLAEYNDADIISYGCSAHYLNLLAKVVETSGVIEYILQINHLIFSTIFIFLLPGTKMLGVRNLLCLRKFAGIFSLTV